jgi:uncharacterized protein (TIGR00251 family)
LNDPGERLSLRASKQGVRLEVEVKVRASRTAVLGIKGERLCVALAAPPVDNAANEALRRLLADTLDLPRQNVQIVGGEKSRRKLVELSGLCIDQILKRLSPEQTKKK